MSLICIEMTPNYCHLCQWSQHLHKTEHMDALATIADTQSCHHQVLIVPNRDALSLSTFFPLQSKNFDPPNELPALIRRPQKKREKRLRHWDMALHSFTTAHMKSYDTIVVHPCLSYPFPASHDGRN